jgi:LacI family transcriptional regulator, galactose operon repressor
MSATMSDVAKRANVSLATVSRVINGNYPVAESTRERVLTAIRDLGYVFNAHARALITATTGIVGVILHDPSDPYFGEIVRGIQEVADEHGRFVVLCNSMRDPEREIIYIEMLRSQRVDAVILAGGYIEDDEYLRLLAEQARGLRSHGARLVMCGHAPVRAHAVVPQNADGAYRITTELLRLGHRRIAHLAGPPRFSTTRERLRGYHGALEAYGATADPALVVAGDFTRDGGVRACTELLDSGADFTAMFAANDMMAVGALAVLRERGIAVPEDVSLAGYDDIPVSRDIAPALTTVNVPMVEMGRQSMRLAVAADDGDENVIRLPTELVIRASVAPPRAGR